MSSSSDLEYSDESSSSSELDLRKAIDVNLPPICSMSLRRWVEKWEDMDRRGDVLARDVFALTGCYQDADFGDRRAKIDLELENPPRPRLKQYCDVNSVIGIVQGRFPIHPEADLKYFMLQSISHTLHSDVHIPVIKLSSADGSVKHRRLHKVPNARFLEVVPRALVRIVFPAATQPGQGVCVTVCQHRELYDIAIRPAAARSLPQELVRTWPETYDDEEFRANTSKAGRAAAGEKITAGRDMQQTGRDVQADLLEPWISAFRAIVEERDELEWARGFFFAVEIRGTKTAPGSMHEPPEESHVDEAGELAENPRTASVESVLRAFVTADFEPGTWFVDIATTIATQDPDPLPIGTQDQPSRYCTFARADQHAALISSFAGIEVEACDALVGDDKRYQKDEVAQLNELAGCRLVIPDPGYPGVCYVQVYSSEKSVTYNVSAAHKAQRTSPQALMRSWGMQVQHHIDPMIKAFRNSGESHSVALRVESRVDFVCYPNCHMMVPQSSLCRWIYSIDRKVFWAFKTCRLLSLKSLLAQWINERAGFHPAQLTEVGSSLIIAAWMMNGLVNRPDCGGTWDEVHDAACVHEMSGDTLVPVRPLGAVFLPCIKFKPGVRQPRVSSLRTVSPGTILYLFGTADTMVNKQEAAKMIRGVLKRPLQSEENIREDSRPEALPAEQENPDAPRAVKKTCVRKRGNKKQKVMVFTKERVKNQFAHVIDDSDQEGYTSEEDDPEAREVKSRGVRLTELVDSYPLQIFDKVVEKRKKGDHWTHAHFDKAAVKFAVFADEASIGTIFHSWVAVQPSSEKWDQTLGVYFPTLEHYEETKDWQGLKCMSARVQFVDMVRSLPEDQRGPMIEAVRKFASRHWSWLPFGYSKQHLWVTGTRHPAAWKARGTEPGGPWIIMNPSYRD